MSDHEKRVSRKAMSRFMGAVLLSATLFVQPVFPAGKTDAAAPPVVVDCRGDEVILKATSATLSEILAAVHKAVAVEITGLESRLSETFSFTYPEKTLEGVIKRLLQQIGETNYAFEFNNGRLARVVVAKVSKNSGSSAQNTLQDATDTESAVKIVNTIGGTQAETAGLRKGDLVLSYGAVDIYFAEQLVAEVNKESDNKTTEMIVVRDGFPMKVVLNTGLIGINVQTVMIRKTDYENYRLP